MRPLKIKDETFKCGSCPNCKSSRVNQWVARMEAHDRHQDTAHFLTITYNTDYVPLSKRGFMTLHYPDVQTFFNKLKKLHARHNTQAGIKKLIAKRQPLRSKKKISYYIAGEYGGRRNRPHYHAIVFNAELDDVFTAWSDYSRQSNQRFTRGDIHTGNIHHGAIRYTLKYISKESRIPLFKGDDRTPEFSHMSKGIGESYLTKQRISWHRADILGRYYVPLAGGLGTSMPRYYAERIYTKQERALIAEHLAEKDMKSIYEALGRNPEYLENLAAANQYKRDKAKIQDALSKF